jgi:hypothetical protein
MRSTNRCGTVGRGRRRRGEAERGANAHNRFFCRVQLPVPICLSCHLSVMGGGGTVHFQIGIKLLVFGYTATQRGPFELRCNPLGGGGVVLRCKYKLRFFVYS